MIAAWAVTYEQQNKDGTWSPELDLYIEQEEAESAVSGMREIEDYRNVSDPIELVERSALRGGEG